MRKSTNFELSLVEGSDIVNPLVQDVPNYQKIDTVMKENRDLSVSDATELKTGKVHAITRNCPDSSMFRFVATSNYESGETFTVDGKQVTALITSGETLPSGAYKIGANVLCCLTGTMLTVFCGYGTEFVSYDSERLGGELPDYYASALSVANASAIAQSANALTLKIQEQLTHAMMPDYSRMSEFGGNMVGWVAPEDGYIFALLSSGGSGEELYIEGKRVFHVGQTISGTSVVGVGNIIPIAKGQTITNVYGVLDAKFIPCIGFKVG